MTDLLSFSGIIGGVCGGIAALIVVVVWARKAGIKVCPRCSGTLPDFRFPTSLRQAMWGGWTCPRCHGEFDRQGKTRVP